MVERALKFEKDEARCRALREIVASAATPSSPGR
jgi:hypothetical protein